MGLLYISYLIEPWYLLILLGIELFTIMTMFNSSDMTLEEAFQKIKQEEARKSRRTKKRIVKKKRK